MRGIIVFIRQMYTEGGVPSGLLARNRVHARGKLQSTTALDNMTTTLAPFVHVLPVSASSTQREISSYGSGENNDEATPLLYMAAVPPDTRPSFPAGAYIINCNMHTAYRNLNPKPLLPTLQINKQCVLSGCRQFG